MVPTKKSGLAENARDRDVGQGFLDPLRIVMGSLAKISFFNSGGLNNEEA
jgi:hypothetical protein